ncbi:methyltransferase, partial [Prunus dulcis]
GKFGPNLELERALPIRIISVGKKRSQGVQLVVDEYIEKLKLYCSVEDAHIRNNPKHARDWRAQVDHEDSAVMDLIRNDFLSQMLWKGKVVPFHFGGIHQSCYKLYAKRVVLLDERGKDIGSEQMAELGASRLSFCIGGPHGHGKRLRERADVSVKLSSMVLNHQIAIVVLVEQLYRSWTILKGQNYHRHRQHIHQSKSNTLADRVAGGLNVGLNLNEKEITDML